LRQLHGDIEAQIGREDTTLGGVRRRIRRIRWSTVGGTRLVRSRTRVGTLTKHRFPLVINYRMLFVWRHLVARFHKKSNCETVLVKIIVAQFLSRCCIITLNNTLQC
jgi:hypothetical protein